MGVNITFINYKGSCHVFNNIRRDIAFQIDIDLDSCIGYKSNIIDLNTIEHPVIPLLNHSDCDGIITPKESLMIKEGLLDILINLKPERLIYTDVNKFKQLIIKWIEGFQEATDCNENIEFF